MQCPDCGFELSNHLLKYCEECGAKLPPPPANARSAPRGAAASARAPAPTRRSNPRVAEPEEEDYPPEEEQAPARPPYHGPKWLEHVPGHSPSVLGILLMSLAVVLGILPFFTSVGPFWSTVTLVGGLLVAARELRATGERHPLVDWVPESLHPPQVVAGYAVVALALALRMLSVGITPILWAVGATLLVHEQWNKVLAGEGGYTRFFQPRLLLKGVRLVALISVSICIVSLFLTWNPEGVSSGTSLSVSVPQGPPQLQVLDSPRQVNVSVEDFAGYGWDQHFSIFVELLLLGALAVLALKPDPERPTWVRYVPLGSAVLSLIWALVHMRMQPGPILFLVSLLGVGFVGVVQAIPPKGPEPEYAEGDYPEGEYGDGEYAEGDPGYGDYGDGGGFDNGGGFNAPPQGRRGGGGGYVG